jgi:hypothetical protein
MNTSFAETANVDYRFIVCRFQLFFARLEEEHKKEGDGREDYSYFHILRWP